VEEEEEEEEEEKSSYHTVPTMVPTEPVGRSIWDSPLDFSQEEEDVKLLNPHTYQSWGVGSPRSRHNLTQGNF
jgi:hypothetical protein